MTNIPGFNVGYSTMAKYLLPHFLKVLGKGNLIMASNYGFMGESIHYLKDFPDIPIQGGGLNGFNEGSILSYYEHHQADALIVIWDIWALNHIPAAGQQGKIIFVPYVPIDVDNITADMKKACDGAFKLIPMSQHTEDLLKKVYPDKTYPHVPGGVNTNVFKPAWATIEEKKECKKKLGFSGEEFIIGLLGDIKGDRKSWPETIEGISIFRKNFPNVNFRVFIHTAIKRPSSYDHDIEELINMFQIKDISRSIDQTAYRFGISEEDVAEVYNGLDLFIQCSRGEGFGLSFIEAQACGTPVIGTDFTAMKQVVNPKSGILVDPIIKYLRADSAIRAIPDPKKIAEAIEDMYFNRLNTKEKKIQVKEEAVKFAAQYGWEKGVFPKWTETLTRLENDLKKACLKPPEPSQMLTKRARKINIIEGK